MLEELCLLSGNDIPFLAATINVHPPTIHEIAFIGEKNFFIGCQLLNISKELLKEEDKMSLTDKDNFDILMSIVCSEDENSQQICALMVLSLIFPLHNPSFELDGIHLDNETEHIVIGKEIFPEFQNILVQIFCLNEAKSNDYKPKNEAAKRIAEKLKKGREKAEVAKGHDTNKIAVFSRYVSILAIGLQMDLKVLFSHTVYQLYDEFKRFQLNHSFGIDLQARMAGATDLDEIDNWMDDIHQ